jgi:hypothetical protein
MEYQLICTELWRGGVVDKEEDKEAQAEVRKSEEVLMDEGIHADGVRTNSAPHAISHIHRTPTIHTRGYNDGNA